MIIVFDKNWRGFGLRIQKIVFFYIYFKKEKKKEKFLNKLFKIYLYVLKVNI